MFDKLLEILVNAGWVSSVYASRAQIEYADMIKNKKIIDVVPNLISWKTGWMIMKILNQSHINLCEVVKLCSILSRARVMQG